MRDSRSDRAKLIENAFHTNISKMPDFVCTFSQFFHVLRQAIVRVSQDENAQRLFGRDFSWFVMSSKVSRNSTPNGSKNCDQQRISAASHRLPSRTG